MNDIIQKNKKILIFVAVFASVFLVYMLFIKKDAKADLTVEKAPASVAAAADNKELLSQLQSLTAIALEADILSSSLFNRLEDNTVFIENRKPEGRRNPFLPIGVDSGVFSPDSTITNATNNINGLLNPTNNSAPTGAVVNISPSNIRGAATTTTPKAPTTATTSIIR
jgi:hypothetical protein